MAREVGGTDLGRLLRTLSTFLREDARTRVRARDPAGLDRSTPPGSPCARPGRVLLLLASKPQRRRGLPQRRRHRRPARRRRDVLRRLPRDDADRPAARPSGGCCGERRRGRRARAARPAPACSLVALGTPYARRPTPRRPARPPTCATPRGRAGCSPSGSALTPFPTLERLLGPVLGDAVDVVERWVGGADQRPPPARRARRRHDRRAVPGRAGRLGRARPRRRPRAGRQLRSSAAAALGPVGAARRGRRADPRRACSAATAGSAARSPSARSGCSRSSRPSPSCSPSPSAPGRARSARSSGCTGSRVGELSRELGRALGEARAGATLVQALENVAAPHQPRAARPLRRRRVHRGRARHAARRRAARPGGRRPRGRQAPAARGRRPQGDRDDGPGRLLRPARSPSCSRCSRGRCEPAAVRRMTAHGRPAPVGRVPAPAVRPAPHRPWRPPCPTPCSAWPSRRARPPPTADADRGDVPGWVMITLMTAGIVSLIWGVADDALTGLFNDAISKAKDAEPDRGAREERAVDGRDGGVGRRRVRLGVGARRWRCSSSCSRSGSPCTPATSWCRSPPRAPGTARTPTSTSEAQVVAQMRDGIATAFSPAYAADATISAGLARGGVVEVTRDRAVPARLPAERPGRPDGARPRARRRPGERARRAGAGGDEGNADRRVPLPRASCSWCRSSTSCSGCSTRSGRPSASPRRRARPAAPGSPPGCDRERAVRAARARAAPTRASRAHDDQLSPTAARPPAGTARSCGQLLRAAARARRAPAGRPRRLPRHRPLRRRPRPVRLVSARRAPERRERAVRRSGGRTPARGARPGRPVARGPTAGGSSRDDGTVMVLVLGLVVVLVGLVVVVVDVSIVLLHQRGVASAADGAARGRGAADRARRLLRQGLQGAGPARPGARRAGRSPHYARRVQPATRLSAARTPDGTVGRRAGSASSRCRSAGSSAAGRDRPLRRPGRRPPSSAERRGQPRDPVPPVASSLVPADRSDDLKALDATLTSIEKVLDVDAMRSSCATSRSRPASRACGTTRRRRRRSPAGCR